MDLLISNDLSSLQMCLLMLTRTAKQCSSSAHALLLLLKLQGAPSNASRWQCLVVNPCTIRF